MLATACGSATSTSTSSVSATTTKLQSLPRRRGQTITKRTSDLYDIYRLLARHNRDGGLARTLASAPHGLATWCVGQAESLLVDEAERGARWLATEGSPSMARVTVEALRAVGGLLVADLDDAS